jgi:class 3 adenylate cyclase
MHPPVRFATTKDGVRIAHCSHGEGPPLIFVRGWICHLEMLWDDPAFRSYFEALGQHYRVIRYDSRGNGLSDQRVGEIDLEGLVVDLETVMDELALTEVVLYGATFGGPIAITYAARHPQRVAKLILDGTYACGQEIASPKRQASIIDTLRTLPEAGMLLLMHLTQPEPKQQPSYRRPEQLRQAISPDVAVQLYSLCFRTDVSDLVPQIRAPTLVMHRRGSEAIPFRLGQALATQIPNARFATLAGRAHNSWEGDASAALRVLGDFLGEKLELEESAPAVLPVETAVSILLLTDMEGSTTLTQRLGDAEAQEVLRTHNSIVRDSLKAHSGSEIKHTGDGIMASFASAGRALECAIAIQRAFALHNESNLDTPIRVRISLNAGEPVAEEEDLFGTAVQLVARICAHAEPGQILVPTVVRELAAGKRFAFSDHGEVALRGFDDPVRLYEVRWREER